ncbi:hypothetical protein OHB00_07725 [Streptomyces sp. NBC_00631]|uniref:hypothetical protein n=1 Tax=Streptomyces sp. NBC_00631 TaxID=2975793 RepID=UPI0030E0478F
MRTRLSGHLETLRPYDLVVTPVLTALGAAPAVPAATAGYLLPAAALGLTERSVRDAQS